MNKVRYKFNYIKVEHELQQVKLGQHKWVANMRQLTGQFVT